MSKRSQWVVVDGLLAMWATAAAIAGGIIVWSIVDLILKNYGN